MLEAPSAVLCTHIPGDGGALAGVSLDLKGIYTCLALSLHIKLLSAELRSTSALESSCWVCAISLPSLCGQHFLQLWTQRQAAHLPNISCHSPPTRSWNWLSGTTGGLCLSKCILPSLVSAIDLFHLILMRFEQVSLLTTFNLLCNSEGLTLKSSAWFFFFLFSWKLCHKLLLIVPLPFNF